MMFVADIYDLVCELHDNELTADEFTLTLGGKQLSAPSKSLGDIVSAADVVGGLVLVDLTYKLPGGMRKRYYENSDHYIDAKKQKMSLAAQREHRPIELGQCCCVFSY